VKISPIIRKILVIMESVNVVARFRGAENDTDSFSEWDLTETTIKHKEKDHMFSFDAVLDSDQSQAVLYEKAGRKMIENL
jgi:hypothetical protein